MKSIAKFLIGSSFLLLPQVNVHADWSDYREGRKKITYEEVVSQVPPSENKRRFLCAGFVTILCSKEKGKLSYEKGIYGNAWDMYTRLKKYSLNIDGKIKDADYLDFILKEGDIIFSKCHNKKSKLFQEYNINHVATYLGKKKVYHQFTDPDNKTVPPVVEIVSLEDFIQRFEIKDFTRPFNK
jgi:cell wall-associated NlpC family hydrolase